MTLRTVQYTIKSQELYGERSPQVYLGHSLQKILNWNSIYHDSELTY